LDEALGLSPFAMIDPVVLADFPTRLAPPTGTRFDPRNDAMMREREREREREIHGELARRV